MAYKTLKAGEIVSALETLNRRISERFPMAGLKKVCDELLAIGSETESEIERTAYPILGLRIASWLLVGVILLGLLATIMSVSHPEERIGFVEFVQLLESGINDLVFIGAGIFFLITLEARIRRKRVMRKLHELRSITHVIDMHQLTKDPERLFSPEMRTESSPNSTLTAFELTRYLDYCSEMLSLIGKLAALYAQDFDDEVALGSVNELENLTSNLSNKIWQKIMIVSTYRGRGMLAERESN